MLVCSVGRRKVWGGVKGLGEELPGRGESLGVMFYSRTIEYEFECLLSRVFIWAVENLLSRCFG